MNNWTNFLKSIVNITDKIALDYFKKVDLAVEYKKDNSPVSEADQLIEKKAREIANKEYPKLGLYGEEYGEDTNKDLRLIIDPIDGTRNFISGIPIFATLLAIEEQGEITAGLVSAPAIGTTWYASKNNGAFMKNKLTGENKQIFVSKQKELTKSQAFHSSIFGNEIKEKDFSQKLTALLSKTARQRGIGDFYQHMLVAQGSGEFAIDPVVAPWDIAPIKIIIEEAGGKFTSFDNKKSIYENTAISSNGLLHQEVLDGIL